MQENFKALIIDDESGARNMMQILLQKHAPEIGGIWTASNAATAIQLIHKHQPDILFLDVEMPHMNGFDLLIQLETWNFDVIFTTAYSQYAIQAIKFSALDYLLKPVSSEDLKAAIQKFITKKSAQYPSQEQFKNFVHNLQTRSSQQFRLVVHTMQATEFIPAQDILYCMAESNYTHIYLKNQHRILASKTLKEFESLLIDRQFCRVHKSWLVNLKQVIRVESGNILMLSDGAKIEIARRKKEEVLHALSILE